MEGARLISCNCQTVSSLDENGRVVKHKKLTNVIKGFNPKWLKPEGKLAYNGIDFTVKGVFSYSAKWEEWDVEDSAWLLGTSNTREYYLFSDKEDELCILHEDGCFYIREEVKRIDAYTLSRFYEEKKEDVFEKGTYQLTAFVGEDDEPLDEQQYAYRVLAYVNGDLTGEGTEADFRNKTVCFYQKTLLRKYELDGLHAKFNPEYSKLVVERSNCDFWRKVAGIPALIFFTVWVYTFLAPTQTITTGAMNFSIFENVDKYSGVPKSLCTAKLRQEKNYILYTRCYFSSDDGEIEHTLTVLKKPENKLVNAISCSFYSESGIDSDGSWRESVLTDDFQFRVPESGEYEFIATPLQGYDAADLKFKNSRSSGSFNLHIEETNVSRWYGLLFLLSFFVWLIAQWNWETLGTRIGLPTHSPLNILLNSFSN
jgi:hypothetical protein